MKYREFTSGRVSVSRLEEREGWLGVHGDPGGDPPDLRMFRYEPWARPEEGDHDRDN